MSTKVHKTSKSLDFLSTASKEKFAKKVAEFPQQKRLDLPEFPGIKPIKSSYRQIHPFLTLTDSQKLTKLCRLHDGQHVAPWPTSVQFNDHTQIVSLNPEFHSASEISHQLRQAPEPQLLRTVAATAAAGDAVPVDQATRQFVQQNVRDLAAVLGDSQHNKFQKLVCLIEIYEFSDEADAASFTALLSKSLDHVGNEHENSILVSHFLTRILGSNLSLNSHPDFTASVLYNLIKQFSSNFEIFEKYIEILINSKQFDTVRKNLQNLQSNGVSINSDLLNKFVKLAIEESNDIETYYQKLSGLNDVIFTSADASTINLLLSKVCYYDEVSSLLKLCKLRSIDLQQQQDGFVSAILSIQNNHNLEQVFKIALIQQVADTTRLSVQNLEKIVEFFLAEYKNVNFVLKLLARDVEISAACKQKLAEILENESFSAHEKALLAPKLAM